MSDEQIEDLPTDTPDRIYLARILQSLDVIAELLAEMKQIRESGVSGMEPIDEPAESKPQTIRLLSGEEIEIR